MEPFSVQLTFQESDLRERLIEHLLRRATLEPHGNQIGDAFLLRQRVCRITRGGGGRRRVTGKLPHERKVLRIIPGNVKEIVMQRWFRRHNL